MSWTMNLVPGLASRSAKLAQTGLGARRFGPSGYGNWSGRILAVWKSSRSIEDCLSCLANILLFCRNFPVCIVDL